ncbi:MAG TPA: response regulator transcription factor [Spirochaetota bacterium]|jgi:DNA-binding NarL/FixJ family response regulator|nr:response regulator transcription factor [Spirochaetota bacterium]
MADKNNIKIMIVDDHPLVRQGMKKVIEREQDLTVISEAGSAEEAIRNISQEEPDLAIVDISLESEVSGIDLIKALRDRYARIKTLVLSMHDENVYAERALKAGARGYVAKKEAPAVIIEAIRVVMKGELYLSSRISMKIIDRLFQGKEGGAESMPEVLSDRELEIFRMIGTGMSTGDIAKKLNISVNTIESHRKKIKDKLGIQKGSELVKAAVQWVSTQQS